MTKRERSSRGVIALASALLLAVTTAGSDSCSSAPEEDAGPAPEQLVARVRPSGDALDLLFVITQSPGNARIAEFMEGSWRLLDTVQQPGASHQSVVDLHAGVIDMDVGDGAYDGVPGCEDPSMGGLRGYDCSRDESLDPPFVAVSVGVPNDGGPEDPNGVPAWEELSCIASAVSLDHYTCPLEQPLESLRLALTDRVEDGTNAGFLREGAVLAVVVLTDRDDCSTVDPTFFDPERDDLADVAFRCFAHPEALMRVGDYADLLLAQRPRGRLLTAGWLTVPSGWDGDLGVLLPDPELDWRTATVDDFMLCPELFVGMFESPRLAELMVLTGGEDLVWSMCDYAIMTEDGMGTIGRAILDRLDPVACLPSAPPAGGGCEVTLRPLDAAERCPEGTSPESPGVCSLRDDQWELVETSECTELRPGRGLEVPPGAALEIHCTTAGGGEG